MTIGGDLENILYDLKVIKKAKVLDLSLNNEKSEIICEDATVRDTIHCALPGAQVILSEEATLLGSTLGGIASIDASLKEKTKALPLLGVHFKHMSAHDSLILLHHTFAIPRLQFLLRSPPCFLSSELTLYDNALREILGSVTNILLTEDNQAWWFGHT